MQKKLTVPAARRLIIAVSVPALLTASDRFGNRNAHATSQTCSSDRSWTRRTGIAPALSANLSI